jgi:hypothetical protein
MAPVPAGERFDHHQAACAAVAAPKPVERCHVAGTHIAARIKQGVAGSDKVLAVAGEFELSAEQEAKLRPSGTAPPAPVIRTARSQEAWQVGPGARDQVEQSTDQPLTSTPLL